VDLAPKGEWVKLDAPMFRAVWPPPAAARKQGEAWKMPVDAVATVVQSLNPAPVKCSLAASRECEVEPDSSGAQFFFLELTGDILVLGLEADHQFDSLICELAFGGVGIEQGHEDHNRPPSTAEKLMRRSIFQRVAATIAARATEFLGVPTTVLEETVAQERKLTAPRGSYISGSCLVNVFGLSAELVLLLPEEHFQKLKPLDGTSLTSTAEAHAKINTERCPFVLTAALPEQQMGIREIMGLQEGDILHLQSTHASPLLLSCGGKWLGDSTFRLEGDAYELEILAPQPAPEFA
jgi:flagellar motor switch protein FliM